jgi:hypothetical protein
MSRDVPAKDWRILTVKDRGPREYYRFAITGHNLNWRPESRDYAFSWSVPDLDDPRYDLSGAVYLAPYNGKDACSERSIRFARSLGWRQ